MCLFSLVDPATQVLHLPERYVLATRIIERGKQKHVDAPVRPFSDEVAGQPDISPRLFPWNNALLELLDDAVGDDFKDVFRYDGFHTVWFWLMNVPYHRTCGVKGQE